MCLKFHEVIHWSLFKLKFYLCMVFGELIEVSYSSFVVLLADLKCESFPGPGADHVVTFNPMQEFIHGDDRHVTAAFDEFLRTHKKYYSRDTEHSKRHAIFLQNLR